MNKTIIHTEPTQYHYDNTKWLYKFMYAFFFGFVQNDDYDYDLKPNKKVNNLPITLYTYDTFRVLNYDYDYFCGNMTMRTQYTYGGDSTIAQAVMPSSETGFDYFGARYYASDLSIWLSFDPLASKYPSMSPYIYAAGNPVMLVDPDGRWVKGAGFFRNLFKSDNRINAENKAVEMGGKRSDAYKNPDGGWNYVYTSNETWPKDLEDGASRSSSVTVYNFEKKKKKYGYRVLGNMDGYDGTIGSGYKGESYGVVDMKYSTGNPMVNLALYLIEKYSLSIEPNKPNSQKPEKNTSKPVPDKLVPQSVKSARLDPNEKIWIKYKTKQANGNVVGGMSLEPRKDSLKFVNSHTIK